MPKTREVPVAEAEEQEPERTREGVPLEEDETDTGTPDVYVPAEDAPEVPSAGMVYPEPVAPIEVFVEKTLTYVNGQVLQHLRSVDHDEFIKELKAAL